MEVQEIMTAKVITVGQDEPVTAAARLLRRWNLGALPVTDSTGRLRGVLTDRDIVLRCLALDNDPADTRVSEVMSRAVVTGAAGRQRAERRRAHGARAAAPSARGGKRAACRHGDGRAISPGAKSSTPNLPRPCAASAPIWCGDKAEAAIPVGMTASVLRRSVGDLCDGVQRSGEITPWPFGLAPLCRAPPERQGSRCRPAAR